jgi:hypothetical protein
LVAASSSFPGPFEGIPFPLEFVPVGRVSDQTFFLVDGGISDNSGVSLILEAHRFASERTAELFQVNELGVACEYNWHLDLLISSDGGAPMQYGAVYQAGRLKDRSLRRFSRVLDIIHRNSRPPRDDSLYELPLMFLLSAEAEAEGTRRQPASALSEMVLRMARRLDFEKVGPEALAYMVSQLPDEIRWDETAAPDQRLLLSDLGLYNRREAATALLLRGLANGVGSDREAELQVVEWIQNEFGECLSTFRRVGTLQASVAQSDAVRLFRLGGYMFALHWLRLKRNLDMLQEKREHECEVWERIRNAATSATAPRTLRRPAVGLELASLHSLLQPRKPSRLGFESEEHEFVGALGSTEYREELAAMFATRVAYAIYDHGRQPGIPDGWSFYRASLLDEIRGRSVLPALQMPDMKIDELTTVCELARRIQVEAGFSGDGARRLTERCLKEYGERGVSPFARVLLKLTAKTPTVARKPS